MGAPRHNTNALKNGSRALYRLILGELPKEFRRVKETARKYRRDLEAEVSNTHGEVSIVMAHHIDAACSWEAHAGVCRWLLNHRLDKMGEADIASCSREIAKAKESRNRMVKLLEIAPPEPEADYLTAIFSQPEPRHSDATASSTTEPPTEPDAREADAQDASDDHSDQETTDHGI